MVELTKGDVRERLQRLVVSVPPAGINVFSKSGTAGGVPQGVNRYVVRIETAAGTAASTLQAFAVSQAGVAGSPITPPWNIAASGNLDEPPNMFDDEGALIRIPGGQDIQVKTTGIATNQQVAVLFFDDEVH